MGKQKADRIMLISRLDYPGEGSRVGLWHLMAEVAQEEKINIVVINGGLVSHRPLQNRINRERDKAIGLLKERKKEEAKKPKPEREKLETQVQVRAKVRERVLDEVAHELAEAFPVITNKQGKPVKVYVTTSPAHNYDGPMGVDIADRLQKLREDIVFWDRESSRFPMKNVSRVLWALNPEKAAWRSKYFSTMVDRLVQDKTKQTSQELPDIWTVGCGGSAVNLPAGGGNPRPMISIPALHRLQQVNTSENQVGVAVVEFAEGSNFPKVVTYNFKDLVARERDFIPVPEGLEDDENLTKTERDQRERQRAIFKEVLTNVPTIGMLEDALRWKRRTLERDIVHYNEQGFEPAIVLDEKSGKYNVSYEWLQHKLRYPMPDVSTFNKDSSVSFSCLHAGYKTTQYEWFVTRIPELIVENGIQSLVGCGDFVAGLKHNLDFRGELLSGANNYDKQEDAAARLTAAVLVRVLKLRLDKCLGKKKPSKDTLRKLVNDSLIHLYYIPGNHDEWVQDTGHMPLSTYNVILEKTIIEGIYEYLDSLGLSLVGLREIVKEHIHFGGEHEFPSGVTMSIRHPHQGRMQTSSGRAQQTMGATKGQVVYIGNFHVGVAVHEWHPEMGQRVAVQEGTIAAGTDFESNMNKLVDTEVGMVRVYSDPESKRIFKTEMMWQSPSKDELVIFDDRITLYQILEDLDI